MNKELSIEDFADVPDLQHLLDAPSPIPVLGELGIGDGSMVLKRIKTDDASIVLEDEEAAIRETLVNDLLIALGI